MIARLLLVLSLVVLLVPGGATSASAHAGGLASSVSEARVLDVEPAVPGLDVRAVEFGARLRISNGTPSPVVVEPLPGSVVSGLPTVAPGARAYFTDPRVTAAAAVQGSLRVAWAIPLRVGERAVTVRGEQVWPPPPSPWWWGAVLLAFAAPVAAGLLGGGRRALGASTLVVIGAHLVHVLGSAGVPEDQPYPLMLLSAAGYALLGWPLGLVGARLTLRGHAAGPLLCVAAGGLFAIVIAPVDAFTLVDAVVPFSWGADLDRALVALTLGGGLGVVVSGVAALRRSPVQ